MADVVVPDGSSRDDDTDKIITIDMSAIADDTTPLLQQVHNEKSEPIAIPNSLNLNLIHDTKIHEQIEDLRVRDCPSLEKVLIGLGYDDSHNIVNVSVEDADPIYYKVGTGLVFQVDLEINIGTTTSGFVGIDYRTCEIPNLHVLARNSSNLNRNNKLASLYKKWVDFSYKHNFSKIVGMMDSDDVVRIFRIFDYDNIENVEIHKVELVKNEYYLEASCFYRSSVGSIKSSLFCGKIPASKILLDVRYLEANVMNLKRKSSAGKIISIGAFGLASLLGLAYLGLSTQDVSGYSPDLLTSSGGDLVSPADMTLHEDLKSEYLGDASNGVAVDLGSSSSHPPVRISFMARRPKTKGSLFVKVGGASDGRHVFKYTAGKVGSYSTKTGKPSFYSDAFNDWVGTTADKYEKVDSDGVYNNKNCNKPQKGLMKDMPAYVCAQPK